MHASILNKTRDRLPAFYRRRQKPNVYERKVNRERNLVFTEGKQTETENQPAFTEGERTETETQNLQKKSEQRQKFSIYKRRAKNRDRNQHERRE
jgi:hypothetical protein